ncbi:MAG: glycosyltransferase [Sediminibacterium sp.]|nr:glycosyl transferase family 28 [Chitinophagaceae bacterium]
MQKKYKDLTVLIAPLDWGLGHTTRCIPLIKGLLARGCTIILAGEKAQIALFEHEFPQIKMLKLKGYGIRYSVNGSLFFFKIIQQLPKILHTITGENRWLESVVEQEKIDLVIADNRYGLYHKKIPTIFITHQLQLHLNNTLLERISQYFLYRWINRFTSCWVPDMPVGIAGKLSHPDILPRVPVQYINLLSRFKKIDTAITYKYCFLISGPEPQRTIFEEKVFELASHIEEEVVVVRGILNRPETGDRRPEISFEVNNSNLPSTVYRLPSTIYNHLPTNELAMVLQKSEYIVCRGGYTSLMELLVLKKKLIVVPTPGQTEQAYLAKILMQQNQIFSVTQNAFNKSTLAAASSFNYSFKELIAFKKEDLTELLQAIYDNNKISLQP